MYSQVNLLGKKDQFGDSNFKTQENDFHHAHQVTTLVVPYSDRYVSNTIQPNPENFDVEEIIGQESDQNDLDVDHRFSSENDQRMYDSDKEEVKVVSREETPNLHKKAPKKMHKKSPYKNDSYFEEKEENKSNSNGPKSEMDKIHDFMEE